MLIDYLRLKPIQVNASRSKLSLTSLEANAFRYQGNMQHLQ
jgi:hypothetical protein